MGIREPEQPSDVGAFLARLGRAYSAGDAGLILGFHDLPVLMLLRGGHGAIADATTFLEIQHALLDTYRSQGITSFHPLVETIQELDAIHRVARVRWLFSGREGPVSEFTVSYQLRDGPAGPRIVVVTNIEERVG